MRFLRQLNACSAIAAALASAACTDGNVMALRPLDAGVEITGASGFGGLGAADSTAGHRSPPLDPPFAGSGGSGGDAFTPCPGDGSSETPLVDALNNAIDRGDFCIRHRLMLRDDLRCDAYNLAAGIAFAPAPDDGGMQPAWVSMAVGWHVLPGGTGRAWWASRDAATVDDARTAMLSEDSQEICDSAQRVPYKWVAVAHIFDTWVVELKADMP